MERPLERLSEVDELFIVARRFSNDGILQGFAQPLPTHKDALRDSLIPCLENVVRSVLDPEERRQAGIPPREYKMTAIGVRLAPECELARMTRELTKGESQELHSLILRCAGREDLQGETIAKPMANGRRLSYIGRVVRVNRGDWKRPPLYIPTTFGVSEHGRSFTGLPPEWFWQFEMNWCQSFEATLKELRSIFESSI